MLGPRVRGKLIIVLMLLATGLSWAQFDTVITRGGLHNTFAKLNNGERLTAAYIGGSVTQMGRNTDPFNGWRDNVSDWFRANFGGRLDEINAGIPGTGSTPGATRYQTDVLNYNPDLVFIEFAINDDDSVSNTTIYNNYKSMVTQSWQRDANIDLCFIETVSMYSSPLYTNGQVPRTVGVHYQVADYYRVIPSVNVGWPLYSRVLSGVPWESLTCPPRDNPSAPGDKVHPNATGHQIYSDAILPLLQAYKNDTGALIAHSLTPGVVPSPPPPTSTPTPPPGCTFTQCFETMPGLNAYETGGAATWSIASAGQQGNCLQATRSSNGSSAKVLTQGITAGTYNISVYMKIASAYTACFWMETGFKDGNNTAQDFNENAGTWTMLQKFDGDCGGNPNGTTSWTQYTANNVTFSQTTASIGFKCGCSDTTPVTVYWDSLNVVSTGAPQSSPTRTSTSAPNPPTSTPPPAGCGTLISQGKSCTASSNYNANYPASKAVDGLIGHDTDRWVSASGSNHWLVVDLGQAYDLCQAWVYSDEAYVFSPGTGDKVWNITSYHIRASSTGTGSPTTWTELASYNDTCGIPYPDYPGDGVDAHNIHQLSGTYRYVSIHIDAGDGECGPMARLQELKLFGNPAMLIPTPTNTVQPPTSTNTPVPPSPTRTVSQPTTTPTVSQSNCQGDGNGDRFVNGDDFRAVRDNFGVSTCGNGDANHDCFVNGDDFRAVRDNFGRGC